jgi:DNA-binding winged helix-turn-helix (wHTH) protein/tetratricopeptide (TPR) repeat protein
MEDQGFAFAGFILHPDGALFRGRTLIHLPPKELAALRVLLENAGQIVTPGQLKKNLWGDVHVTADSVPKCISSLRSRLEPDECIQTVYKRGYRFSAEVSRPGSATSVKLPRLAIMPFATGRAVPEHLGSVIAEETIARLSNASDPMASVLARDSVFTLAQRGLTAQQLGESLKSDLVLTGTLLALPAHFRLRVEMIRVEDCTQIWVEDLLVARDRIAGIESELFSRLQSRLGGGGLSISSGLNISAAAERDGTPHQREAYEIFQRGRYEWQTLERHRMQDGLQKLARAAELDPSLISAKVDLVRLCVTQAFYGFMSPAVEAELVQRTASSIPDSSQEAPAFLPALGWVNFHWNHNLAAAIWAFDKSADLSHDPWNTRLRSIFELSRHRFPEAIALLRAALRSDPYSPRLNNRLAWALHLDGQAEESVAHIRRDMAMFPNHGGTSFYGTLILAFNRDAALAMQLAEGLARRRPHSDLPTSALAYALACAGRSGEARDILERLQWLSRERYVLKCFTPAVYVALGDLDSALSELQAAGDARCPWFFQMLADPRLKPLDGCPEFVEMQSILTRMEPAAALDTAP